MTTQAPLLWFPSLDSKPGVESSEAGLDPQAAASSQAWLAQACRALDRAVDSPLERRRLEEIIARARDLITSQREEIERLERLALVDELTGIYNWRGFDWQLRASLDEGRRTGQGGVLIYVDLDDFKRINDTHGHSAGNAVLKDVAAALSMSVRGHDTVGRLGGDEFAALLVRTTEEQGTQRAREIGEAIDRVRTVYAGDTIRVAASVGVVTFARGDAAAEVLERADRAMYAQKGARKLAAGAGAGRFGSRDLTA